MLKGRLFIVKQRTGIPRFLRLSWLTVFVVLHLEGRGRITVLKSIVIKRDGGSVCIATHIRDVRLLALEGIHRQVVEIAVQPTSWSATEMQTNIGGISRSREYEIILLPARIIGIIARNHTIAGRRPTLSIGRCFHFNAIVDVGVLEILMSTVVIPPETHQGIAGARVQGW